MTLGIKLLCFSTYALQMHTLLDIFEATLLKLVVNR